MSNAFFHDRPSYCVQKSLDILYDLRHTPLKICRELVLIGLRGILSTIMDPTVEPDPDNAGGGKKPQTHCPLPRAFFMPLRPLPYCLSAITKIKCSM